MKTLSSITISEIHDSLETVKAEMNKMVDWYTRQFESVSPNDDYMKGYMRGGIAASKQGVEWVELLKKIIERAIGND